MRTRQSERVGLATVGQPAQLGRRALPAQAATRDDGYAVGQPLGLGQVVRGDDHGVASPLALQDVLLDGARRERVERRGRLVEQQHGRLVQQGARERDLLTHALGEGV